MRHHDLWWGRYLLKSHSYTSQFKKEKWIIKGNSTHFFDWKKHVWRFFKDANFDACYLTWRKRSISYVSLYWSLLKNRVGKTTNCQHLPQHSGELTAGHCIFLISYNSTTEPHFRIVPGSNCGGFQETKKKKIKTKIQEQKLSPARMSYSIPIIFL